MQHLRAIAAHSNFLKRVRNCLGEGVVCNCYKPHTDCDFGKWWYGEVYPRREQFSPEAQDLIDNIDAEHQNFHEVSKAIAEATQQGEKSEAASLETALLQSSNRLIQEILKLDKCGGFESKS